MEKHKEKVQQANKLERLTKQIASLKSLEKEKTKTINKLRKSVNRLQDIIETTPDLVWEIDQKGIYTYISSQVKVLLGYEVSELLGKPAYSIMSKEEKERIKQIIMEEKPSFRLLSTKIHKDGHPVVFETHGIQVLNEKGRLIGYRGISRDISEQLKTEEMLRDSEKRYRAIFEQAADSIVLVNADTGELVEFNDKAHNNLGYTREEFKKLKISDFEVIESVREVERHIKKVIEKGSDIFETQHKPKKGEIRDIQISARAIIIGKQNYTISIWRDITDKKRTDEKAKKSLEEKEILLSEIHHRVKNNMAIISSLLSIQADKVRSKKYRDMLEENITRINAIAKIHEILYKSKDVSRIDFKEYVNNLCQNIAQLFMYKSTRIKIEKKIIKIYLTLNSAIPCGLIINELLSNSYQHAFPGKKKGKISISLEEIDGKVLLKYVDNGIGMPENVELKNPQSLGLKIVNLLVQQLHGEIELHRMKGTHFTIIFKS